MEIRLSTFGVLPQYPVDETTIAVRDSDVGRTLNEACDGVHQKSLKGQIIKPLSTAPDASV